MNAQEAKAIADEVNNRPATLSKSLLLAIKATASRGEYLVWINSYYLDDINDGEQTKLLLEEGFRVLKPTKYHYFKDNPEAKACIVWGPKHTEPKILAYTQQEILRQERDRQKEIEDNLKIFDCYGVKPWWKTFWKLG